MAKKNIMILSLIFFVMLLLNYMTPLYNEDYFATFVWPMGVPNLGELPENVRRVLSVSDYFDSLKTYYFTGGGRVPGAIIGGLFANIDKVIFDVFNSFVFVLLIVVIYWLSHKGRITLDFDFSWLVWIFFALWTFNGPFVDTYLWMSGAINYLWMMVVVLLFLLPYVRDFYSPDSYETAGKRMAWSMFFIGLLAGCSHETTICCVILLLFYWLYLCKKENMLQAWKITGFTGLCIGYTCLVFAPGNFTRLGETQYYTTLDGRIFEFSIIFMLQFILWYFIIKFLRIQSKINANSSVVRHLKLGKAFLAVSVGATTLNTLLPVSCWRPSFLSLVFLIITFSILYTSHKEGHIDIVPDKPRLLLKAVGYTYLIFSIICCLHANFSTWQYWNHSMDYINTERELHPDKIVVISCRKSKPYESSFIWNFLTMYRVVFPPVGSEDENDRINRIFARYYDIKGIRVENDNSN